MPKIGKFSAEKVLLHKTYGTPRKALAIKDTPRKGTPRAAAESFLRGIAKNLGLRSDLSDLKFDKVVESPLGAHVFFQQYHDKKPITGAWVKIDLDQENRAYHFTNSAVPVDLLKQSAKLAGKPTWTEAAAQKRAMEAVDATPKQVRGEVTSELVNFPVGKSVVLAWKFLIP